MLRTCPVLKSLTCLADRPRPTSESLARPTPPLRILGEPESRDAGGPRKSRAPRSTPTRHARSFDSIGVDCFQHLDRVHLLPPVMGKIRRQNNVASAPRTGKRPGGFTRIASRDGPDVFEPQGVGELGRLVHVSGQRFSGPPAVEPVKAMRANPPGDHCGEEVKDVVFAHDISAHGLDGSSVSFCSSGRLVSSKSAKAASVSPNSRHRQEAHMPWVIAVPGRSSSGSSAAHQAHVLLMPEIP